MWLTHATVWLFFREGVAKCPCKCGSLPGIYSGRAGEEGLLKSLSFVPARAPVRHSNPV